MIEKNRHKEKTDQAWNTVYARLEQDGLLEQGQSRFAIHRTMWIKGGIAAAIALLCITLSVVYWIQPNQQVNKNLLTQLNKESSTTLVTTLEDGSVVYLAGNTSIRYPEHFPADKREISLQGNALFDITGNRARPFVIETEDARIEVLGTSFDVKSETNSPFELSVKRGEVKVTLKKSGQNVHVKAGETVTLRSRQLQLSATSNPKQFAGYTERIRFKDESLANILRVVNLQSDGLQLETVPGLENRTLTVTFSNNTPEEMAELICMALNLKQTKQNRVIKLSE